MRFIKETIGIILIIVFVISIEIITEKITNNSLRVISQEITNIEENGEEKIEECVNKLSETWKNEEAKLSCYMEHDELEEISKLINSLKFSSKKNDTEKIEENIDEIKFKMEHIKNKQKVKIKNIF